MTQSLGSCCFLTAASPLSSKSALLPTTATFTATAPICPLPSRVTMAAQRTLHIGDVPTKLAALLREQSQGKETYTVAVSGGSLPKLMAQGLSAAGVDTAAWRAFLADERVVPLDDPDSNFREIRERLPALTTTPIDPALSPDDCAVHYATLLPDSFDAVLLGLGPDGHTCSLFPAHPLLTVDDRSVASIIDSPKPPPLRITLTLPVLNAAASAIFVCTGAGKAPVVKDIFENPDSQLPGALVLPTSGSCHWFLDEGAASDLSEATKANAL